MELQQQVALPQEQQQQHEALRRPPPLPLQNQPPRPHRCCTLRCMDALDRTYPPDLLRLPYPPRCRPSKHWAVPRDVPLAAVEGETGALLLLLQLLRQRLLSPRLPPRSPTTRHSLEGCRQKKKRQIGSAEAAVPEGEGTF